MKNQAIQYLALDVHQATTVASMRDERGRVVMRATVPTEARALLGLVRGLSGPVEVAFEEGTQAQWLHDLLVPHVSRVTVCNVRGRGEKANKNDQLDADDLPPERPCIGHRGGRHGWQSSRVAARARGPSRCSHSSTRSLLCATPHEQQ